MQDNKMVDQCAWKTWLQPQIVHGCHTHACREHFFLPHKLMWTNTIKTDEWQRSVKVIQSVLELPFWFCWSQCVFVIRCVVFNPSFLRVCFMITVEVLPSPIFVAQVWTVEVDLISLISIGVAPWLPLAHFDSHHKFDQFHTNPGSSQFCQCCKWIQHLWSRALRSIFALHCSFWTTLHSCSSHFAGPAAPRFGGSI